MDFNTVIQNRYSCRAFAAQEVEPEKVERILEAGRIAPTAVNKQPVHVWAVTRPETLEAICNKQTYFRHFFVKLIRHFAYCFRGSRALVYS